MIDAARPKTLEEAKEHLRARLRSRRNPMVFCDPEEAAAAIERLEGLDGEKWASVWTESGSRFEGVAREAEARGDMDAAVKALLQAHAFYFVGRYPCPNHPRKLQCYEKARETFLRAAPYLVPPITRIALPFSGRSDEGSEAIFYLRRPLGVTAPPVLLVWGGIDTWKEEAFDTDDAFLRAGVAVAAIDMPGTGESPVVGSKDAERQFTPVLEWLRNCTDLDGSRIACMGRSFGGYWATKIAHTHRQYLCGAASWGGSAHYTFQPAWIERSRYADSYLMELLETRARMLGGATYEDYVERVGELSLLDQEILDGPCAPLLLVNGKDDRQTTIEDLYLVLEHGDPKSARVFPGGHMGDTPDTRPIITRWLLDRLLPS